MNTGRVEEIGEVLMELEGKYVCKCTVGGVPILRREVYLEDQAAFGTIDDVYGTEEELGFVVEQAGSSAKPEIG